MGVTQSFAGLVVCRVLLGFFEAGFLPGPFVCVAVYMFADHLQAVSICFPCITSVMSCNVGSICSSASLSCQDQPVE